MKKTLLWVFALVAFVCIDAQAQRHNIRGRARKKTATVRYATNSFLDNWDISVGGGFQFFNRMSEVNLKYELNPGSIVDRATLGYNVALTKWLSPFVGGRIQFQGGEMKTYSPDQAQNENKFSYIYIHTDALLNITNIILGYDDERIYNLSLIGGFGWAGSTSPTMQGTNNEYASTAGIWNRFRVSEDIDISVELKASLIHQTFDNTELRTGNRFALIWDGSAGLVYKIPTKRDFDKVRNIKRNRRY